MAATNFTPISLYYSTTASAVPTSGNLIAGELALNTLDEKLYFKNSAGTVKLLAANITPVANGGTALSSTPSNGQLLIGNGSNYTLATITAGSGISVTNGSGSITIASTASVAAATPTALGTVYGATPSGANFQTFLGYNAGVSTSGQSNTAIGYSALSGSATGAQNVAIGREALNVNTSGENNVAVGYAALTSNSSGSNNVAIGRVSLLLNTTASDNTAVGYNALDANTTGGSNVALGSNSLGANTTASYNTAVGHLALFRSTTGSNQTAVGYNALAEITTGAQNTAIGWQAGATGANDLTTGSNNTLIGHQAAATSASVSNEITLGNASVTAFRIPGLSLTWNTTSGLNSLGVGTPASGTAGEIRATNNITAYYSDDRLKKRLGSVENALDKVRTLDSFYYEANETAQELGYEPIREVGISAQQVQAVLPEVVVPAPIDDKYLTVRYERLVPLLIAAIKELEAKVQLLESK